MNQILKQGQKVDVPASGTQCTAEMFLGGGGQGEVYRADWDNKPVALKWYFPHTATSEQRSILEHLIEKGAPNDKFLWPMAITSSSDIKGFGYIMPLREAQYKSLFDLMARRINPGFTALTTAGVHVANSFLELHAKGLCYRDISFGNLFFNPTNGDVLICDNDNVSVDGSKIDSVLGTPDFMAPEIVRDEAGPSTQTDLFSLAVLLFYMLHTHHPLYGKKVLSIHSLDLPARRKLCGDDPLFIFHPTDKSNEALPESQDPSREAGNNAIECWKIYPEFLKEIFTRAFVDGLQPNQRVRESEWRAAMGRLRDSIFYCGNCGNENFYDEFIRKQKAGEDTTCWICKTKLQLPFRMKVGNSVFMLNHDTKFFQHHLDNRAKVDFSTPVGEINRHPKKKDIWGIKNLTSSKWIRTSTDNKHTDIEPGKSVSLDNDIKINFGVSEGTIKY